MDRTGHCGYSLTMCAHIRKYKLLYMRKVRASCVSRLKVE